MAKKKKKKKEAIWGYRFTLLSKVNWINQLNCASCKVFLIVKLTVWVDMVSYVMMVYTIRLEHLNALNTIISLCWVSIQTLLSRCQDEVPSMLLVCSLALCKADRRNFYYSNIHICIFFSLCFYVPDIRSFYFMFVCLYYS